MTRKSDIGMCESCNRSFPYIMIHNGFNDTAYAYCDSCGMTAFVGGWGDTDRPADLQVRIHSVISPDIEQFLSDCQCGGKFKSGSSPRCPHCRETLSPEIAREWIEANFPGVAKGWRWQGNWTETYAVIIDNQRVENNWKKD